MASPRTIDHDEPFDDIDTELAHTSLFLLACPQTTALAPSIASLRGDLPAVHALQAQHSDAVQAQEANAVFVDDEGNTIVDEVKVAALAEVKGDYQASLYKQLFVDKSPTQLKKPILGDQLDQMRTWPAILASTSNAALHALGLRTAKFVALGDAANAALASAQTKLDAFLSGPRAVYVDKVNAARKLTYGKLAELAHSQPAGTLPAGFAERFFLHDTSGRAASTSDVERTIARLEKKLNRHKGVLAELNQKQATAQKTKQDLALAEKQKKLALAQKTVEDASKALAALEAELAKGDGG
jgi:hypothetical protein